MDPLAPGRRVRSLRRAGEGLAQQAQRQGGCGEALADVAGDVAVAGSGGNGRCRAHDAAGTIRREDGSGRDYTIPQGTPIAPKHFCIPTELFTAGWHLVLTPNELVTFLALSHVADLRLRHDGSTIMFLAEQFRYSLLGLTDEAYVSIHELAEFCGLIEVTDPIPNRKRGRIQLGETGGKPPEPYNISVPMFSGKLSTDALFDLSKFNTPAIDCVMFNWGFEAPRFK
ncbi:hypothetical protein [Mycolicibacterium stellerae]|uniref:hypothetical protein n=1 Tax=Mycolicibacterium stellerae TaxID=2358193 RepID=UPI0019D0EABB|nr:hypothetical protein [Mycolicibacterium stellerae]